MDLRQIYGELAKKICEKADVKGSFVSYTGSFHFLISTCFFKIAQVEAALISNTDLVPVCLSTLTSVIIEALEVETNGDWCLRTPKLDANKFRLPESLTQPIRASLADICYYKEKDQHRDAIISLEFLLKRCIELSMTLDFDLSMAIAKQLKS